MTYALGIDLGTTYTAAAVARNGRAETAALGYRATSVPTVVLLTADGRFLVGDAAERRASREPRRVAREFKRRVGDPAPLLLGGTPIAVDRCLAEVLRWVVATIGEAEGGPPAAVTVTHPANWGEFKLDVLREALRMVGLPQARLLAEPVAAATWYAQAERLAPGRTIAVYDLGGGTFDATVLRRLTDGRFESLGRAEGIDRLGGIDVDEAVFGYVLRAIGVDRDELDDLAADAASADDTGLQTAISQLRRACVEAKEVLSTETSVTIPVWLPGMQHDVLLQRAELEELVGPLLRPTVDALGRVVASAGLRPDDLDAVLLVGGSSRIPLIGRQVSAGFGRPVVVDAHPKHPVALGAALDAAAHLATLPATASGPAPSAPVVGRPVAAPPAVPPAAAPASSPGPGPAGYGPPPAGSVGSPAGIGHYRQLPALPGPLPVDPTADRSSRRLLWVATLVTPVALVTLILFTVLRGQDVPTANLGTGGGGGSSSVDLLEDPTPALDDLAGIYEGPPQVRELLLRPELAVANLQVPDGSGHVDEYTWHGVGDISEPTPVMDVVAESQGEPFTLSEVDPAVIPVVAQHMLENCPGEDLELTHVVVERAPSLDPQNRVLLLVYAENPDRGGGGYIAYTATGAAPVANHCDP